MNENTNHSGIVTWVLTAHTFKTNMRGARKRKSDLTTKGVSCHLDSPRCVANSRQAIAKFQPEWLPTYMRKQKGNRRSMTCFIISTSTIFSVTYHNTVILWYLRNYGSYTPSWKPLFCDDIMLPLMKGWGAIASVCNINKSA